LVSALSIAVAIHNNAMITHVRIRQKSLWEKGVSGNAGVCISLE
jgi:hypothetical protein